MITVRNLNIGEGLPKICLPIVGKTREEILTEAKTALSLPCDLLEWRADFYENILNEEALKETLLALRALIGEKPLLFTVRTKNEGGELAPTKEEYEKANRLALSFGADMIDCELFFEETAVNTLIAAAHEKNLFAVISNHDFHKTPSKEEICARLKKMEALGGDIAKIAVMPQSAKDVLTLLSATEEASRALSCPIITMSMGAKGAVSRLCGEVFGSAVTFGCGEKSSAPGQVDAAMLSDILTLLHKGL